MNLDLNIVTAILLGLMCGCTFVLDIITAPEETRWFKLPRFIRWQIRLTAVVLMVRSINLFSLSKQPEQMIGQANWVALILSVCLTGTVISLTFYAASNKLPARAWDRVIFVLNSMRGHPERVAVVVSKDDVIEVFHAMGQPAVDGNDPKAVYEEGPRFIRQVDRRFGRRAAR